MSEGSTPQVFCNAQQWRHTAPVVSDASAQDGASQAAGGGLASSLADFVICSGAEVGLTTAIFPYADPRGPGHGVRFNA